MKKNEKGFTLVEFIVSFTLVVIVLVYILRSIIVVGDRENSLLALQEYTVFEESLLDKIYSDINDNGNISFVDDSSSKTITIKGIENILKFDTNNNQIIYDGVIYELPENVKFDTTPYTLTSISDTTQISNYSKYDIIKINLKVANKNKNIKIVNQKTEEKIETPPEPPAIVKACSVTSGTGSSVGDMITCGTESFYVIKNDGNTIDMLSQYNVDTRTNLQSESANTVAFGTSSDYDTSYVKKYAKDYANYLVNTLGVESAIGRIIIIEELNDPSIGCSSSSYTCSSAPSFIRSTAYWTSSASYSTVWFVNKVNYNIASYSSSSFFGVRPLIKISVNEI